MKARWIAIAVLGVLPAMNAISADGPHDDPSSEGSVGLLTLPRATTLGSGQVAFGIFYETLSREEGSSNVERGGLTAAYGLSDRFELFTSFEPRDGIRRDFLVEDAQGLPSVFAPRLNDHPFATSGWDHGLGDLRVGAKVNLVGEPDAYNGLAVDGVLKIPTADQDKGIGTGKVDFGADLIASLEAGATAGFNGRLGLLMRGDPDEFEIGNELRWGLGLQLPTRSWLSGIVETYGVHYINQPDISPVGFENYTILQGGLRLSFANGLAISGGVNTNLSIENRDGVEPEKIGSFVQVSISTRRRPAPAPPLPPPPTPPTNQAPTLSCRAESTTIRQGESVRLVAEASDREGDPITVGWSASVGTVTPTSGPATTWSSAGVAPGVATITASASDGINERVTCAVRVRVEAPPAPAAPTVRQFVCDAFPARSARIDNRCKAVLDDVALQVRANPRASLRITGYGDPGRTPNLAAQRAENARSYLMNTHQVEAGRATVESSVESGHKVEIELTIP